MKYFSFGNILDMILIFPIKKQTKNNRERKFKKKIKVFYKNYANVYALHIFKKNGILSIFPIEISYCAI